jgi:ATP synthase protein I
VDDKKPRKHPLAKIPFSDSFGLAIELPFILVSWVLLSGGIGYLLDHWLHTAPVLMIVLGLLGFGGGVWDVLRRMGGGGSKREENDGR